MERLYQRSWKTGVYIVKEASPQVLRFLNVGPALQVSGVVHKRISWNRYELSIFSPSPPRNHFPGPSS